LYKAVIAVVILGLLLSACAVSGTQKPGGTAAPTITPEATQAPVEATPEATEVPAAAEEKTVFVVFFSEDTEDFSALTVKSAAGEEISPVTSESTGQPVYGVFTLPAGEYRFTMANAGEGTFRIDAAYDKTLVPVASPDDLFQTKSLPGGVMINPVYEGIISEEDLNPLEMTTEEEAAALREFYQVCRQDEQGQ